jgi:hypothetical protein
LRARLGLWSIGKLLVYQAIWAMENQAGIDFDYGFDDEGVSLMNGERAFAVARNVLKRSGTWEAGAFVRAPEHLTWRIKRAENFGARRINVQIQERKVRVSDAVTLMRRLEDVANSTHIPMYYESHRGD